MILMHTQVLTISQQDADTTTPARKNIVTHFVIFFNAITNFRILIEEGYL
jgi:hypothetical protein